MSKEFGSEKEKNIKYGVSLNEEQKNKVYGFIYKITSPSRRVYIGKSVNIKQRYNCYFYEKCSSQPKIYNSIKTYGFLNHSFEIIDFSNTKDGLNEKEIYYIQKYNSFYSGLNLTFGGDGVSKGNIPWNKNKKGLYRATEATIVKLRASQLGRKRSEEAKNNYRQSKLGVKNPMYNKPQSEEVRKKKSLNSARSKRVLDTYTGKIYNSIFEAATSHGTNRNTLQYQLTKDIHKFLKFYVKQDVSEVKQRIGEKYTQK